MSPTEHFEVSNLQLNEPSPVPVDPILAEFQKLEKQFFEISAKDASHFNTLEKVRLVTTMVFLRNKDSISVDTRQTIDKAIQQILS